MIGKPISGQELADLLAEEDSHEDMRKRLASELTSMKPGECLLYETAESSEGPLSLTISLLYAKNSVVIRRPGKVYVYKAGKK